MSVSSQEQAILALVQEAVHEESFRRSPSVAFWLDKQRVTYEYTFLDVPQILHLPTPTREPSAMASSSGRRRVTDAGQPWHGPWF